MSNTTEHGLTVKINKREDYFFMDVKITGTLTHEDYQKRLPMLRYTLNNVENPKVKVLVDALDFQGWELRAAWDDYKFGMEYNKAFTKIAFVGGKAWKSYGVKIGNWFMSGQMKYFKTIEDAEAWLSEDDATPLTPAQKDLQARKDDIQDELESLFKDNLRRVDWNVPEADDQNAAEILVNILEEKLENIKNDVNNGVYKNY